MSNDNAGNCYAWPTIAAGSCICLGVGAVAGYWYGKRNEPSDEDSSSPVVVTDLFIYPIKSCAGFRVSSARITERGFEDDRLFMITDFLGRFQTQRTVSALVTLRPRYTETGDLLITASGVKDYLIRRTDFESGEVVTVTLHRDKVDAIDQGPEVGAFLSTALGIPGLKLVYLSRKFVRNLPSKLVNNNTQVSFADVFPYLLTSESSLEFIRTKSGIEYLSMNRFRPNIVIGGPSLEAFQEDNWSNVRIGDAVFDFVSPCTRCKVTRVDPWTGERHESEPTKTLTAYRSRKKEVLFGQNVVSGTIGQTVKVGHAVHVLGSREPPIADVEK